MRSGRWEYRVWLKKKFHHVRAFDGNEEGQKVSS